MVRVLKTNRTYVLILILLMLGAWAILSPASVQAAVEAPPPSTTEEMQSTAMTTKLYLPFVNAGASKKTDFVQSASSNDLQLCFDAIDKGQIVKGQIGAETVSYWAGTFKVRANGAAMLTLVTDANGQAFFTVAHDQPGTAEIVASITVTSLRGVKINPGATVQKLVLDSTEQLRYAATAKQTWAASPSGTLTSACVNGERVWTATVGQSGTYVVEFIRGGNVVASQTLNLTANTPPDLHLQRRCYPARRRAPDLQRLHRCHRQRTLPKLHAYLNANQHANTDTNRHANADINLYTAANQYTNLYTAATTSTPTLTPTGMLTPTPTFTPPPTNTPTPTETPTLTVRLTPQCTEEGLVWEIAASQSGVYQIQLISEGTVIETVVQTLTANTPQTFAFEGDSTTPNVVRVIYQDVEVLTQEGPEPCVSGLSVALARVCMANGYEWTVITNRSGDYVVQLVSGNVVIESINLTLTAFVDEQFIFQNDPTSSRVIRLLY